ncbi:hypothetical protein Hamer_G000221 [Homarus americanus]|uniref:Uncharacterized protein n=1 Tax=Homarus americanus TaxID=6706 RepID=A0A8J5TTL1_HOMAM|nr:hypothetical protein Hamer_G000221 [Homarus americanus]
MKGQVSLLEILVKEIFAKTRGTSTFQLGNHVSNLLHGLHLLLQVLIFQKLGQSENLHNLEDKKTTHLVDLPFQIQSSLQGIMSITPFLE